MYEMKKWNDILTIVSGKNQKEVENKYGKYPIYGSGGIIGRADDFLCGANAVIVGRKGTINNPLFVTEPFWNIDTAFGIVAGESLLPKYLYYFCKSYNFKALDKSTGRPSIAKSDLLKIEMPVPDISEQRRIVLRMEEIFSSLDNAIETLNKTKEQLAVYRQAVLNDVFGNITKFELIKNVSEIVTSGSRGWAKYYSDEGALFIRIGNLTRMGIDIILDDKQYVELPEMVEGKRSRLQQGDVLVSITADLGSIGYVDQSIGEAYVNQHIAMVRFKKSNQSKMYAWFLRSQLGQRDLLKNKRGAGKLGLGLVDIKEARVPDISDEEADCIMKEIDLKLSVCASIEETVDKAFLQAQTMRQSILKEAFRGEL